MNPPYRRLILVAGLLVALGVCLPLASASPTATNNTTTPATPPVETPQSVTQGDLLSIDVGAGTADNVTLTVESDSYSLTARTQPNTTVRLNTYLAGTNATSPLTNATVRSQTHRDRIFPANTTLNVTANTSTGESHSTTVQIRPRTPGTPTVWRGPTTELTPETLTPHTIRQAIAQETLTQTDQLVLAPNHTETLFVELDAAGLAGLFAATGATTPDDQLAVLRETNALELNLTAISNTSDRKTLSADSDLVHVVPDFTNDTLYLGLTVDPAAIDASYVEWQPPYTELTVNDTLHVTPTITDSRLLGEPAAPLSGATMNASAVETYPGTATLTAPTTAFSTERLRVLPTTTTITFQTNLAPGTQGMLTVQSTDAEASFLQRYMPTVGPNGTVAKTVDFEGLAVPGDQFTVSTDRPFVPTSIDGEIIDLTMAQPEDFKPNVTLEAPHTVQTNNSYPLTATVGNSGGPGNATLTIAVDDQELETTDIELNPGTTANRTVQTTPPAHATTLSATALYGTATANTTITVNATPPTNTTEPGDNDAATPGFGVLVGILTLLALLAMLARRD